MIFCKSMSCKLEFFTNDNSKEVLQFDQHEISRDIEWNRLNALNDIFDRVHNDLYQHLHYTTKNRRTL